MTTDIFLQDTRLNVVADENVPCLCEVLEAAGHSVLWNAGAHMLLVDSPLEGRLLRCEPLGDGPDATTHFLSVLHRQIHMAGGIVTDQGVDRAELTLRIKAEPCEPGDRPRVLLRGRRRHWFARRGALAQVVEERMRTALRIPVKVAYTGGLKRKEMQVYLWAPAEAYLPIAQAVWLGLAAYFRTGPAVPAPALPSDLPASLDGAATLPRPAVTEPGPAPSTPDATPPAPAAVPAGADDHLPAAPPAAEPPAAPVSERIPEVDAAPAPESPPPAVAAAPDTQAERARGGVFIQKVPYHDTIPGAVVWSSPSTMLDGAALGHRQQVAAGDWRMAQAAPPQAAFPAEWPVPAAPTSQTAVTAQPPQPPALPAVPPEAPATNPSGVRSGQQARSKRRRGG